MSVSELTVVTQLKYELSRILGNCTRSVCDGQRLKMLRSKFLPFRQRGLSLWIKLFGIDGNMSLNDGDTF
jgi:hypothetical protein